MENVKNDLDHKVAVADYEISLLESKLSAFLSAQDPSLDVKELSQQIFDTRQSVVQLFRRFSVSFHELRKGYDIQGCVILALARKAGVDFDSLLETYVQDELKEGD